MKKTKNLTLLNRGKRYIFTAISSLGWLTRPNINKNRDSMKYRKIITKVEKPDGTRYEHSDTQLQLPTLTLTTLIQVLWRSLPLLLLLL
jgi:hypothetical protein